MQGSGIPSSTTASSPLLLVRPEHDFDWIVVATDEARAAIRASIAGCERSHS
jgi:hypothetical protein